jgi:ribosomal protein S18 acetylase RimI-like enzyme
MLTGSDAIAALESNAWSMFSILGTGEGGRVTASPTRLVVESPIPQPPYNGVWRFYDEADRPLDRQVAEVLAPMRDRGVAVMWLVHPTSPPAVREHLRAEGLVLAEELPGMVADLRCLDPVPAVPESVEVFEASAAESDEWVHLVSWRYGLDSSTSSYLQQVYANAIGGHTRLWIAHVGGEPVSKAALHCGGGVAGIYGVVTAEKGRGRGLATILTLMALHAARDQGFETGVLHSTPMARGLYERLGYRACAVFEVWAEPETLHL